MRKLLVSAGLISVFALAGCGDDASVQPQAETDVVPGDADAVVGDDAADVLEVTPSDVAPDVLDAAEPDSAPADVQVVDVADAVTGTGSDVTATTDAVVEDVPPADGFAPSEDATATDTASPDVPPQCVNADSCDDNNPCTLDTCDLGTCNHADIANCVPPPAACDASHPCATGVCDPISHACIACLVSPDCGANFLCQNSACVAAPGCKSDVECKTTKQVCSPTEAVCVDCNSASDCGTDQVCNAHTCVAAPPCKSSKDCIAVCDVISGTCVDCVSDTDCKTEQFCNTSTHTCTADLCTGAGCVGGAAFACLPNGSGFGPAISCDDGNLCTDDSCKLLAGCVHANNSAPCTDGTACTTGDACSAGTCVGVPLDCNDNSVCTVDACDVGTGCTHTNVADTCDDGLLCTGNDGCVDGKCVGAAVSCDDGKQCTGDTCIEGAGCAHTDLTGTPCIDGNACTVDDTCVIGLCAGGTETTCDDGSPCTADSCDVVTGCLHTPVDAQTCDDASLCTVNDACLAGKCVGTAVLCDDLNVCTDNTCDPISGCLFTQNTAPCSDNDLCTADDKCAVGKCISGAPQVCDDKNSCTVDSCDPTTGCVYTPTSGATCDDGDFCTVNDVCTVGVCGGTANACDDGNACSVDTCASGTCTHGNAVDGTPCGTFDGCTGDFCTAGTCLTAADRLWEKQIDAPSNTDTFAGTARTSDGGFILSGETAVQAAGQNGWLVKLDGGGTQKWAKSYGGNQEDRFRGVVANADGTITAVGAHGGNGGDGWLLQVDAAGTTKIDAVYGSPNSDQFRALAAAPAGGWIAVGNKSVAQFPNFYTDDGWLMRFAADGGQTWEKTFGSGQAGDVLYAVVAQPDGTFVAAGSRGVGGGFGAGWLLKVDANGTQVWSRTYNQNFGIDFRGLAISGLGFAIVGWTTSNNGTDALLQFANADGNGAGQRTFNKTNQDYLLAISPIATGGFLMAGQVATSGGTAWTMRTDAAGNEDWSKTWGGANVDAAFAVQVEADLTAIVAGVYSNGNTGDGFVRHIDLFGNASCAASGSCITKIPTACEDNNPCTLDLCGAGVCSHANLPNGTTCGSNGEQCDVGVCGPG